MEHQKYQHSKDKTGECANSGFSCEEQFKKLAESKGYEVLVAGRNLQFCHVDFILKKDGVLSVRAEKRFAVLILNLMMIIVGSNSRERMVAMDGFLAMLILLFWSKRTNFSLLREKRC